MSGSSWKEVSIDAGHTLQANYKIEKYTYYRETEDGTRKVPLHIQVESATTTKGGDIVSEEHDATGIMIWPATHLFCQHVAGSSNPLQITGQHQYHRYPRVLEAGCGCGLLGITACKSQDAPLLWVSTDMDERTLDLCRRNFSLNEIDIDKRDSQAWVRTLRWGNDDHIYKLLSDLHNQDPSQDPQGFDAVVGADIVYPTSCGSILEELFRTVDRLLAPEGTFWLSFCSRDGPKTPSRLLEVASEAGFHITCLPDLDASITSLLPPLLDSKMLILRRSSNAKESNQQLGGDDCEVFPRLRASLARLDESSSEEEWEPPFDGEVP